MLDVRQWQKLIGLWPDKLKILFKGTLFPDHWPSSWNLRLSLQGHQRSKVLMPYERPHMTSYDWLMTAMSISGLVTEIQHIENWVTFNQRYSSRVWLAGRRCLLLKHLISLSFGGSYMSWHVLIYRFWLCYWFCLCLLDFGFSLGACSPNSKTGYQSVVGASAAPLWLLGCILPEELRMWMVEKTPRLR